MIRRTFAALVLALNLAFADQAVKEYAAVRLKDSPPVEIISGFFSLAYVENRGCAWGMLQGQVWPLAALGVAALALLVWKREKVFGPGVAIPAILYAGIAGNAIDRIFRGHVIDMFDFRFGSWHYPCFNLADAFICIAVALMLLGEARSVYTRRSDR